MAEPTLHVRIISPQQVILDTQAVSVSSKNSQGDFDILPQHANFITMIEHSPIIVRLPGKKHLTFGFPLAIVLTNNNTVNIYTYITYIQPQTDNKTTKPASLA
ncbi:hypothetical protein M1437_02785 [Patescibacteria group bacterium]|nr:hypothetical protein [Patescibacteria group bacterium]